MPNSVSLHYFRFSDLLDNYDHYRAYLSPDEIERADKFYFERDRKNFVIAHGVLRELLAQQLKLTPQELTFIYGPHGKPALARHKLHFNLAHTREAFIVAISEQGEVGIDLELTTRETDIEGVGKKIFSAKELAYQASLPADQKKLGFFRSWARKEAFIKALGVGMSIDLTMLDISVDDQETMNIEYEGKTWQVQDLPMRDQHCLALSGNFN